MYHKTLVILVKSTNFTNSGAPGSGPAATPRGPPRCTRRARDPGAARAGGHWGTVGCTIGPNGADGGGAWKHVDFEMGFTTADVKV